MQHSELTDGDGVLACEGYPAPGLGQAFSCCPPQRYLDEAEREKQQYMKELRAYQQSEAYKMCTEKIDLCHTDFLCWGSRPILLSRV